TTARSTSLGCRRPCKKQSMARPPSRELAQWFHGTFSVSCVRGCRLANSVEPPVTDTVRVKDHAALGMRIRGLAHARTPFSYIRIGVLLCREGWLVNWKRVRRRDRLDGVPLQVRGWRQKHIALHQGLAPTPVGQSERWSMEGILISLMGGRPFRILTVVDN
ncbi:MAG: hypothetical protein L0H94_15965, partial [Nitrospira sp.]|nr:hypothetical protein [Nitrospira sp.]